MVPASVTVLSSLPRLASGKVDRGALPTELAAHTGKGIAPRGALEETVAGIWCRLLNLESVGAYDNFFEVGGHSLLLIQVQNALEEALERAVPVLELFRHPTVAALAAWLGQGLSLIHI